ncbi:hypothetical protein Nepgr_017566 [Nepenthes gracilis]|uniref:Zinc-ribbon domain-containing protein n=1 Tax=Nepenthes gracilis TaxID=150966 RepID=A0AAD3SPK7_NEPGR|nr:hypothetical protein Nepgr_017566 [Nepenthes gracilis]
MRPRFGLGDGGEMTETHHGLDDIKCSRISNDRAGFVWREKKVVNLASKAAKNNQIQNFRPCKPIPARQNMTNRLPAKVRMVRCPKCTGLLREPAGVPLYICGGCDTTLVVKHYNRSDEGMGMGLHEPGYVQNDKADHVPNVRDASGPNRRSSFADGSSSELNEGMDQQGVENSAMNQLGGRNSDSEASSSSSNKPSLHESKVPLQLPSANEEIERKDDARNCHLEQLRAANSARECSSSNEPTVPVVDEPYQLATTNQEVEGKNQNAIVEGNVQNVIVSSNSVQVEVTNFIRKAIENVDVEGSHENVIESFEQEQLGVANTANEAFSSTDNTLLKNTESLQLAAENGKMDLSEFGDTKQEQHEGDLSSENPSSSEIDYHERDRSLVKSRSGKEYKNEFVGRVVKQVGAMNLSSKSVLPTDTTMEKIMRSSPLLEADSSCPKFGKMHSAHIVSEQEFEGSKFNFTKDSDVNNAKPGKYAAYGFKRMSSDNGLATTEQVNAYSQGYMSLKEVPKSPIRCFLAYDGSVSSLEGNDSRFQSQNFQLDKETLTGSYNIEDCNDTENKLDEFFKINMTCSSSEAQYQANNSPAMLPKKNQQDSVKGRISNANGLLEGTKYGIRRNMMMPKREKFPSQVPFFPSSPAVGYESSSSCNCMCDGNCSHVVHQLPYWLMDPDLSVNHRSYMIRNGSVNRRKFPELPGKIYAGREHHRYHGVGKRATVQPPHNFPRIPYSGDTVNSYYHPYFHHHPDDVQWSHLPPPAICCDGGLCTAPSSYRSWNPYDSFPHRMQRFTDPEYYARGHDMFSGDPTYRDHIRSRKKDKLVMQCHFRPIAGGAPFVSCYECYEVLQLPVDFLMFSRSHKLKCGKCESVLEFSLETGRHLVPYMPEAMLPSIQAAETDDADKSHNLLSASQGNHSKHHGASHSSCVSVEVDQLLSGDRREKPMDKQRGKLESKDFVEKRTFAVESCDPAVHYSGQAQQIKVPRELPARSTSPLHRLMGYSTPDDLLKG